MPPTHDPFDAFRRTQEQGSAAKRRASERALYASRISRLLDELEEKREPEAPEESEHPPRTEVQALIASLYGALDRDSPEIRARISSFLHHFLTVGRRLLNRQPGHRGPRDLEFEMDFGELFDFMLNPDVESLRRR